MQVEWLWGLGGGLVIGLAGAVFLLMSGRIMGASGLIGGLVDGSGWSNAGERIWFLIGLFTVPALIVYVAGGARTYANEDLGIMAFAGILVGIGTRLANGCTSGHGICGISRLSIRGIVATVAYILAGGLAVGLLRTVLGVI